MCSWTVIWLHILQNKLQPSLQASAIIMEKAAQDIVKYCCKSVKQQKTDWKEEFDRHNGKFQTSAKLFNDSVHGSIEVNSLELAIIDTLEFSRLKDIKQLGGKFHVYPGATHTRFQHSIGVCHIAGEFMQHLKKQEEGRQDEEPKITQQQEFCVRIAGLCHDLGHGPFSHLFEKVTKRVLDGRDVKHESLSRLIMKKILLDNPKVLAIFVKDCQMTVKEVKMVEKMISPDVELLDFKVEDCEAFLYEIVANKKTGMDVDKWDYFARDFLHLGVTYEFDWRRCMKMSSIVKVGDGKCHIGFKVKEMTNVYGMFRSRSILHIKALLHDTVEAIEMMLEDILCFAKDIQYEGVHGGIASMGDALLEAYKKEEADLSGYLALTDGILHLIRHSPIEEAEKGARGNLVKAQKLIDRLKTRDLYKMIAEETLGYEEVMKHTNKVKESIEKYNTQLSEDGKIQFVCFKFSPEDKPDPVEDMLFFKKPQLGQPQSIPTAEAGAKIQVVSPLCKPAKFIEYRIRLYKKDPGAKDEDLESKFKDCHEEIKKTTTSATSD